VHKIFQTNLDKYKTFKFQRKYISLTYKPTLGLLSSQPAKKNERKWPTNIQYYSNHKQQKWHNEWKLKKI